MHNLYKVPCNLMNRCRTLGLLSVRLFLWVKGLAFIYCTFEMAANVVSGRRLSVPPSTGRDNASLPAKVHVKGANRGDSGWFQTR